MRVSRLPIQKWFWILSWINLGREKKIISKNIDLKVIGPEKICIVGENGAGKTTLLKEIYKHLEKSNLKIGYMPQDYFGKLKDFETPISYLAPSGSKEEKLGFQTYLAV